MIAKISHMLSDYAERQHYNELFAFDQTPAEAHFS